MRRVLVALACLTMLGLTTGVAADFGVSADDITSFRQDVDITIPEGPFTGGYALIGSPDVIPGALLEIPEPPASLPDTSTQSKSFEPGGSLQTEARPAYFHEWRTPPLTEPLSIASPVAQLFITQPGGNGQVTAGLFECDAYGCTTLLAAGTASPNGNTVTISFGEFSTTIPAGNQLGVRVVNSSDKKYNLQWGYKDNRPARIVFETPPSPAP